MTQLTFGDGEYAGKRKQTRREVFLSEMEQVVPWSALLALIGKKWDTQQMRILGHDCAGFSD